MLNLSKCAFNFSPEAVVYFEKAKLVGWNIKVVYKTKTVEFHIPDNTEPTSDDARRFAEVGRTIKPKSNG